MTLTLEIPPETEAALKDKAMRRGLSLDAYLLDLAERDTMGEQNGETEAEAKEAARRAAIKSLRGKYAHLGISSAMIRAERDKDKVREDRFNERFERASDERKGA